MLILQRLKKRLNESLEIYFEIRVLVVHCFHNYITKWKTVDSIAISGS